jgi:hypothetical protein
VGDQYLGTGWFSIAVVLLLSAFILVNIWRANHSQKKGEGLHIRRIPGLNAIDEAVGRATEMGRPILMVPGVIDIDPRTIQAVNIFSHVARKAAQLANPILLCTAGAALYTVAQEVIRDVYQQEGLGDSFDPDSVRFITDRQFAFASGVSGLLHREKVAAAFFMGPFFAESLIFAETANTVGAIQVSASTETTQTPFFIAACDYVLIGDEFYAASAYLTRQPVYVGSLVGQDWGKIAVCAMVIFGSLAVSNSVNKVDKRVKIGAKAKKLNLFVQYMNPKHPDIVIKRDKLPKDQLPKPSGDQK